MALHSDKDDTKFACCDSKDDVHAQQTWERTGFV